MSEPLLKFYAVKSRDGKYYRNRGYGGSRDSWVEDLDQARVWAKPGPARSQISYFAEHYPDYGIPLLVELYVSDAVEIDESERVKASAKKREDKESAREIWMLKEKADRAQQELEWAKERRKR